MMKFCQKTFGTYIFKCSKKVYPLDTFDLQLKVKRNYIEQQMLQKINLMEQHYIRKWTLWNKIFDGI